MNLPPPVQLPSAFPAADLPRSSRSRSRLTRRVTVVTQVSSLVALTSTGALVGWMGQQAQAADQLKLQHRAAPAPVVVPAPVRRPVTTVVVTRTAPAVPQRATRPRTAKATVTRSGSSRTVPAAPAPKPRATTAPPATSTSGS